MKFESNPGKLYASEAGFVKDPIGVNIPEVSIGLVFSMYQVTP